MQAFGIIFLAGKRRLTDGPSFADGPVGFFAKNFASRIRASRSSHPERLALASDRMPGAAPGCPPLRPGRDETTACSPSGSQRPASTVLYPGPDASGSRERTPTTPDGLHWTGISQRPNRLESGHRGHSCRGVRWAGSKKRQARPKSDSSHRTLARSRCAELMPPCRTSGRPSPAQPWRGRAARRPVA
jgi:hypothetical protein